ncbi:cell wall integrity and stress response component 3-like isoform X2 [Cotesia glomerata]|uniref:cell wall integrity and stress response component 3-like isoform X2 n=1 Tax=Cotesia glomerata TaxID=32391 RepID=UPI001D02D1EC|nr:cell wall integrity and stress response component 3-like isoform X2 [Cotesia glomerata]
MFNSRINLNSLVFISLFITCNVHKGTSLQCYQCESNSDGECWSDLSTTLLVTCGDENSTTPNPLTNLTTIASTTTSTTESTTESTTPLTTASTTESTTSFTTTSTTESTTPSTTAPTTEYTTFSTTESTTPSTTASTTESTTSSTTNSTSVTRIASDKSRFRRSVDLRADGAWECIKHIKKEGDEEIVNRKCAKTSEKFCNDKAENSCFVCSDKDACNSASNIGFQIIFMTLPLTVVFFFSTIIPSYLSM